MKFMLDRVGIVDKIHLLPEPEFIMLYEWR